MAFTYIAQNITSDLSGPGADFDYSLLRTTAALQSVDLSVAKSATETSYLFTDPDDPSSSGVSTGTWTLKLEVITGDTNLSVSPSLRRINSGGTSQAGPIASATGSLVLTSGIQTWTWTNPILGTWATGDRVRVDLPFVNAAAHATTTITLRWNNTASSLLTPFTFAGPMPYSFSVFV